MNGRLIVWNVQRLFAPGGSTIARALDATSSNGWTSSAYKMKIARVAAALKSVAGQVEPAIVILIEVENARVVSDLIRAAGWSLIVDAAVPGEQVAGYDIAVLYNTSLFERQVAARSHTVENRYSTRDVLEVTLLDLNGNHLTVVAVHWPSRKLSGSDFLRAHASYYCSRIIEARLKFAKEELFDRLGRARLPARTSLLKRWNERLIVAGDFNDNPFDPSVRELGNSTRHLELAQRKPRFPTGTGAASVERYLSLRPRLLNPSWRLLTDPGGGAPGTYRYGDDWHLLDQVIVSAGAVPLVAPESLKVSSHRTLTLPDGTAFEVSTPAGPTPFDAASGVGVSDHFPLVAELTI